MKRTNSILTLLLTLSLSAFSQTNDVATLSKGRYIEVFENDTLQRIGSVMFNTVSNKIEYFIEESDSVVNLSKESSRWMSMDPLAAKYPSMSPYNFVGNNPIVAIDPNGKEIQIVTSVGELITYTPGMTYSGDFFAEKTIQALNDLYNSNGNKIVQQAVDHKKIVSIVQRIPSEAMGAIAFYDPITKELVYDPELGADLINASGKKYGHYSSKRILSHELRHFLHDAINHKKFKWDSNPENPDNAPDKIGNWDNVEEKNAIEEDNSTFPTEIQRTGHSPTPQATDDCLMNQPQMNETPEDLNQNEQKKETEPSTK